MRRWKLLMFPTTFWKLNCVFFKLKLHTSFEFHLFWLQRYLFVLSFGLERIVKLKREVLPFEMCMYSNWGFFRLHEHACCLHWNNLRPCFQLKRRFHFCRPTFFDEISWWLQPEVFNVGSLRCPERRVSLQAWNVVNCYTAESKPVEEYKPVKEHQHNAHSQRRQIQTM